MAGTFDYTTITRIQQANDIVDVIGEHLSLARKGSEMVGLCPFHEDHRPSLNVNPVKQIFKCFSCGAGGDVFKFIQMRESLTFPQAVERLAERAAIQLPKRSHTAKAPDSVDPNKLAKLNAWAAQHFQDNLWHKQKGLATRKYLTERKISPETAEVWHLGLALTGDCLSKAANAKSIPTDLLIKAGLVTAQQRDKFVNRLMFTITDVTGRTIGFGGRTLADEPAKYINSPATPLFDKSNCLYGLEHAKHHIVSTGTVIVVEGYTDCIMAHQFDCKNVIATLGTSLTTGHGRILKRYAKNVVLLFDSDTAGVEAGNRALEVCLANRIDIKIALLPAGNDPCDFLLAAGKEKFQHLIENATDVFEFKYARLKEAFDTDQTFAGRSTATEQFLQTVAMAIRSGNLPAIDRGLIINRLTKIVGLNSRQINTELAKRTARAARTASYVSNKQPAQQTIDWGTGLAAAAQREIIEVLLNQPKLLELAKQKITVDDFDVPILRQIADIIFATINTDAEPSLKDMLARTESTQLSSSLVELAEAGEQKANFESRLKDAIDAMLRDRRQKKIVEIKQTKDQKQFLKRLAENISTENPHNVGMV